MKLYNSVFFAILGCLLASAATAQDQKGVRRVSFLNPEGQEVGWYGGSYALVIGISDYTAGWDDLTSVPSELEQVRQELRAHGFEIVEGPLNATAVELKSSFEAFFQAHGYEERNRLLVFFSGHGYSFKGEDRGFLVPSDAPDPRVNRIEFRRKALQMSQIIAWSKQIDATHVLFLFDSCFSGTIFKTKSSFSELPPHIADATAKPVRQFISAGSAGQVVPAKSVFTPHFARALRGEADLNGDDYVTGAELGMYLHEKVLAYGKGQIPQHGKILDPDLNEGDFVFQLPKAHPPDTKAGLEELLKEAEAEEKSGWDQRLVTMRSELQMAEAIEAKQVSADVKLEAWESLLATYAEDNPFSDEDEVLRRRAEERLKYWRVEQPPSAGDLWEDRSSAAPEEPPEPGLPADVGTFKEVARLEGHSASVLSVAWSPDGRTLASAGFHATVRLWDVSSRKQVAKFVGHSGQIYSVAWSPDGRIIASASPDATVRLWDVSSRKQIAKLAAYSLSVAWSPDGRTIASANHWSVELWDVRTRRQIAELKGHGKTIWSVAWSPDGRTLASGAQDSIRFWDFETRRQIFKLGRAEYHGGLTWSPDGRILASGSRLTQLRLWDIETRKRVAKVTGLPYGVRSVAWSPDGRTIAWGSYDDTVRIWNVDKQRLVKEERSLYTLSGHSGNVITVAWSPDSRVLASGSDDKTIRLWSAADLR